MTQPLSLDVVRKMTKLELEFAQLWDDRHPNIDLVFQYPFGRHRADFCHPQAQVIVEVQGGTWVSGMGHSSGRGIEKDYKKFCKLAALGFLVFPLTCEMITTEQIDAIAQTIRNRIATKL